MTEIARDYRSALALITAHPDGRFSVTKDGAIQHERNWALLPFGQKARKTEQLQRDAQVGTRLMEMYSQALVEGAPGTVDPVSLDVAARFIQACEAQRQHAGAAAAAGGAAAAGPALHTRTPSAPQAWAMSQLGVNATDNRGRVKEALRQRGLRPNDLIDQVKYAKSICNSRSPAQLTAFNAACMGGGDVGFRVIYEHPECLDEATELAARDAIYAQHAAPLIDSILSRMMDQKESWMQEKLRADPDFDQAELELLWTSRVSSTTAGVQSHADLSRVRSLSSGDTLKQLSRFVEEARFFGLTADQAMGAIRIWMGDSTEPLSTEWERNPAKAPDVNELSTLFMLLDQESVPLTDAQANAILKYLPPAST